MDVCKSIGKTLKLQGFNAEMIRLMLQLCPLVLSSFRASVGNSELTGPQLGPEAQNMKQADTE